jgi:nucleotide-binding universal stress UspA family protein
MFKTLVVALDLEADGDRALPVVEALSRAGSVVVDLVTVSSPGMPSAADAYELERRARAHGWDCESWSVVHDVDVGRGLVQHAARRDDPLLVMATSARPPWCSSLFGGVPHDVLRNSDRPVLLIGPNVPSSYAPDHSTLLACLDAGDTADRAVPAIVAWQQAFATEPPEVVEVVPERSGEASARGRVGVFADLLVAHHLRPITAVLTGDDPVEALEREADHLVGPVFAATSARYTDGRLHWHSTTRDLVHGATRPVLVVPARPGPLLPRRAPTGPAEHVAFRDMTVPELPSQARSTTAQRQHPMTIAAEAKMVR